MAVGRLDVVVGCAKIGGCGDEVDVVVCVVILLELDWCEGQPGEGLWWWKLLLDLLELLVVIEGGAVLGWRIRILSTY